MAAGLVTGAGVGVLVVDPQNILFFVVLRKFRAHDGDLGITVLGEGEVGKLHSGLCFLGCRGFGRLLSTAAAGRQGQHHDQGEQDCQCLFHVLFLLFIF